VGTSSTLTNQTTGISEDCLFIDVYAPANATSGSALPVYFWIQGGGFNQNANANYDGSSLIRAAAMDMVVVTFNYRVSLYGFLASQEVEKEGSLNNGLKDQIKALQWVKSHIRQFGGNPDHIVIGGHSAGGASVSLLLVASGLKNDTLGNLFHGAIAQSPSFGPVLNVTESQYQYDALIQRVGCGGKHAGFDSSMECLRSLSAVTLQARNKNIPYPGRKGTPIYMYGPVIDYDLIPELTVESLQGGHFHRTPLIIGGVTNEGTAFVPRKMDSGHQSSQFLQTQFPAMKNETVARVEKLYPVADTPQFDNSGSYWRQTANAYGELRYTCPGLSMSSTYSNTTAGKTSTWAYRYDVLDPKKASNGYGVAHGSDVATSWALADTNGAVLSSINRSPHKDVIRSMQGYWTSFIRSLDPNLHRHAGTPEWVTFATDSPRRLLFHVDNTAVETVDHEQLQRCAYLDTIAVSIEQ
jgi:carboxylesterase type B